MENILQRKEPQNTDYAHLYMYPVIHTIDSRNNRSII